MDGFKLSPQQRQLWRLQQGAAAGYAARCAVLIEGDLRGELLAQALAAAVRRNEILRTTFVRPPGLALPLQVVVSALPPDVAFLADGGGSTADEGRRIDELFEREAERRGDLERGPVLHATICRLGPGRHVLTLALPALCTDSAGLWNLVEETIGCYRAALLGGESEAQSVQYPDIAEILNDFVDGDETEAGRAYWSNRRSLAAPAAGAAADPGGAGFAPRFLAQPLAPALAAGLATLAGQLGIPVAALLLAAWQAVSWRLDGGEVMYGVCCDGRSHPSLAKALGLLARFLPVAVPVEGSMAWSELARRTSAAAAEVLAWQDSYASELRAEAWLARCFEYEERPAPWPAGDLRLTLVRQRVCFDRFDLKLAGVRQGEVLWSEWCYDGGRFERAEIERLAERWLTLLGDAVAHPERPLGELDLLGEAERRQLVSWNGPRVSLARQRLLPRSIAEQAMEHPELPAVECAGRRLSYGELNARANQVAHRLRSLGAGAESRVALSAPRSLELLVGMLGILKAGAAYVPLDPGYPVERLAHMLEDSGAGLVLAVREVAAQLPPSAAKVLWLDEPADWAGMSAAEPEAALDPAQAAYLIYTSGSTGRPKGVAVSHANLLHSTAARWSRYGGRIEGFLVVSSLSFDSSVAGLFWTLSRGGMVCLPAEGGQRDALALAERIGAGGITHLLCLPSLYAAMLESADRLQSLRVAIVAGESCPPELPARHRERLPAARLFNEYGPTEGTVWSTVWEAPPDGAPLASVPIGRAIPNVDVWLMDAAGQPAAVGLAGEIHLGGGGVARGYVNRPALTAERFVPDGLSGEPGARLYRTGDRGRWSADGELSFLGRADRQVKLRGHRIELGEVESALRSHPGVGEAAVVLRDDGAQGPRLVGYWSRHGGPASASSAPAEPELREWLREKLPEPMVPSAMVEVAEWPRTPNGKLDERALPAPDEGETGRAGSASRPARSAVEQLVAAVWADVLGRAQEPGRDDSFFDLGGHSLLATQVVSRLRSAFQIDLTLPMLFAAPTLSGLAASIEGMRPDSAAVPPLVAGDRPQPLPLSYAQQRLWFLDQMHPGNPFYNVNATVRLRGGLAVPALARALRVVVERHEVLRTRFPLCDGQPVQEIAAEPQAALEEVDLSGWPEAERESAAQARLAASAEQPFDLARGPLLRTTLIRLSAEDHLLLLSMHHIVSDGWSMGVLVRELTVLYAAFLEGRTSPLAPLPIQYADFACWQRGWLQGEVLEAQLGYWRQRLDGAPAVLELPTDRPRPALQRFRGETRRRILSPGLREAITALARREGVTLFMALAAAFDVLLHDYVGRDDIVMGTNVANRNRQETEGLVGFFLNQLVLRTDLGGDPSFVELLARVRETALGAYAHQDLSFDMLVAAIRPERTASRSPLYQVFFTLHNAPLGPIELPGLTVTLVDSPLGTAKFDLAMALEETDQGLLQSIEYDVDLFDGDTIERMLGEYEAVVAHAVAHPEDRLSKIEGALAAARRERQRARNRDLQTVSSEKLKRAQRRQAAV